MKEKRLKGLFVVFFFTIFVFISQVAFSVHGLAEGGRQHEVIFVLDISGSMQQNDPDKLAPDSVAQLMWSLPASFQIGLITYQSDMVDRVKLGPPSQKSMSKMLNKTNYYGYTNTGVALQKATEMFTEHASQRSIVLLTDGEIAMETSAQTKMARQQLEQAVSNIKEQKIQIHTIALGDELYSSKTEITKLAERTGGQLFETKSARGLSQIASDLAFDVFGVKKRTVGAAQMSGVSGTFRIALPAAEMDVATVLITAETPVDNIAVSANGSEVSIQTGKRFGVVQVFNPQQEELVISFTASGDSIARLILEADVALQADVTYHDTIRKEIGQDGQDEIETIYTDRVGVIELLLINRRGSNLLRSDDFFIKNEIILPVSMEEEVQELIPTDGSLQIHRIVDEDQTLQITVDVSALDINMLEDTVGTDLALDKPDSPTQHILKQTVNPTVLILTVLGLMIALFVLFYLYYAKKKKGQTDPIPIFESKFQFVGKLNIYITKTAGDLDIPPQTFDLFRLGKKREISLQSIFEKCRIMQSFVGVKQIYFVPGKQGELQVVNDSDCTILIGRDILVKKRSHALQYGGKIHITCEDELCELELHYKNVKPSEQAERANPTILYAE